MWTKIVISIKPACSPNLINISCFVSYFNIVYDTSVAILVGLSQKNRIRGLEFLSILAKIGILTENR